MQPTISYTIAMLEPHTHLYSVTMVLDALQGDHIDLALPVWTPGSYMVREYARHVQDFAAAGAAGTPLAWRKQDKTTWRVTTNGAARIEVSYRVFAHELSVRTSHLDGSHGYFNPGTICMYVPGRLDEPHGVTVVMPAGWHASTGLEHAALQSPGDNLPSAISNRQSFVAHDYDELVDCPFECGTHRLLTFEVDGIPHEIALWGHGNEDETQFLADVTRIVETERDMFGGLPYKRYLFIFHLADGYGGLEHRNSVTNLVDRWSFQPRKQYERVLALTSHEFFHVWNIKRIRPEPLGPFDYSRENYTRQLWTIEGVTSYYDNLLLLRAGLINRERYLEMIADDILVVQGQPGRQVQSLEQSSFDAWIKYYRPDENSPNSAISYYIKGSLVALLLDIDIRQRTNGARSLDDVLRALFAASDGPGFAEDGGFQEVVEEIGAGSFDAFFQCYIAGVDELDYTAGFERAGLELQWSTSATEPGGAWIGLRTKTQHERLIVTAVLADGPAYQAGIYAGDELVALDGFRIDDQRLKARLSERRPGDGVTVTLFRRDQLLHVTLRLAATPPDRLTIAPIEHPSDEQQEFLRAWLGE